MWLIFLSLGLGVIIGAFNLVPRNLIKKIDLLTTLGVLSLLFVMGLSIGTNKSILKEIHIVGLKGFTFAFFTSVFSIITVYFFTKVLKKE